MRAIALCVVVYAPVSFDVGTLGSFDLAIFNGWLNQTVDNKSLKDFVAFFPSPFFNLIYSKRFLPPVEWNLPGGDFKIYLF